MFSGLSTSDLKYTFLFQVFQPNSLKTEVVGFQFVYLLPPMRLAFFLFQSFSQPIRFCLYQTIPAPILQHSSWTSAVDDNIND